MTSTVLTPWQSAPAQIRLDRQSVHLWRFRLTLPADDISACQSVLSADELARAERLLVPVMGDHFTVARGRLRQILGRYLGTPPGDIQFSYTEHGKPRLAGEQNLSFNLSHAGCWGLLGVTAGIDIGVDIEKIDPHLEYAKVAQGFFTPAEIESLEQYPLVRRRRGFFRVWTRKEAFLKGLGYGFSSPSRVGRESGWLIRSFAVDQDYLGALAVADRVASVRRWDYK